jgi:hypothetical protein
MSSNYDRRHHDKENSLESSSALASTAKHPFVSNNDLRRKLDLNLALVERGLPNEIEESDVQ